MRKAHIFRPVRLAAVIHHLILDDDAAIPYRRGQSFRLSHWTGWPIGESTPDPALVKPGDDLRLAVQPMRKQTRLVHRVHEPDRRVLHGDAAEACGIEMGG